MKKHDVTGMSIALVDDRGLIWAEGFGYADIENAVPATPETVYRVASISKLFTATAVMQLAEQGRIDIDEPLTRYLPEFSIKTRFPGKGSITPRNMMTHHSGLPANFYKGILSKHPEPFTKVIKELGDEYAAYPPDFVYSYSNLGVTLLGNLIERVGGKDFTSYMDESLLRPLGMASSSFSAKDGMVVAKGYRKGKETSDPAIRDLPASGLLSNAVDMGRFMQMVLAGGESGGQQYPQGEDARRDVAPSKHERAPGPEHPGRPRLGFGRFGKYGHQECGTDCAPRRRIALFQLPAPCVDGAGYRSGRPLQFGVGPACRGQCGIGITEAGA